MATLLSRPVENRLVADNDEVSNGNSRESDINLDSNKSRQDPSLIKNAV